MIRFQNNSEPDSLISLHVFLFKCKSNYVLLLLHVNTIVILCANNTSKNGLYMTCRKTYSHNFWPVQFPLTAWIMSFLKKTSPNVATCHWSFVSGLVFLNMSMWILIHPGWFHSSSRWKKEQATGFGLFFIIFHLFPNWLSSFLYTVSSVMLCF